MATNIPPHNLGEVVDAICAQIDNPQIDIDELMTIVKGPDFPTGCTIMGFNGIRGYQKLGRGSIKVRGTVEVVESKGKSKRDQIVITEIPYQVNRATLVERIAQLVNEKVLPDISGIRDESDENTRVVIDVKRDGRPQVLINLLYKHTRARELVLRQHPRHRRRPAEAPQPQRRAHLLHRTPPRRRHPPHALPARQGRRSAPRTSRPLLLAISNLDDFIKMIRDSANREEAFHKIKAYDFAIEAVENIGILVRGQNSIQGDRYVLTDSQVNRILDMRLYQLTALERDKVKANYDQVLEEIKDLLDILANEHRVLQIIKDELNEIKEKYATPRLTGIEPDDGEINIVDLIANESSIITISRRGYIKRTAASEYRAQKRGGKGVRGMATTDAQVGEEEEEDFVEHLFAATAHDYLMFFTDTGRCYVERVYQIPEAGRASKGRSIKNLLNLQPEESIASVLRVEANGDDAKATFDQPYYVLFATSSGKVKKTKLSEFRNFRKDGIIAIRIEDGNSLVEVKLTTGEDEICLVTSAGYCVRTKEDTIRPMGRPSAGVAGIRPRPEDKLVALVVVNNDAKFLVASENGLGKRTAFEEYLTKGRGGKGMKTMNVTEKTGKVIGALAVEEKDELMLMTTGGQSVRIRAEEVRETGRAAQGVKLVTLKEGELLQDIARVVGGDEEEDSGNDPTKEPEDPTGEEE